jgi:hypothetical protein
VAIGNTAGRYTQGVNTVSIGSAAAQMGQGQNGISIGTSAGLSAQGINAIAIGATFSATQGAPAYTAQGQHAISIGTAAGSSTQGSGAIAIGIQSGQSAQGINSIAIGTLAGATQGANAIHINSSGFGATGSQAANTLILNASGSAVTGGTANATYIAPLRSTATTTQTGMLFYTALTNEVRYITASKTFVIDHPLNPNKYLIHACLEGPEAGIYYRGQSEIIENKKVSILLPDYVSTLGREFTAQVTQIFEGEFASLACSEVVDNQFTVHSNLNGVKFNWVVYAKRGDIAVDPYKNEVSVKGEGPYRWI